MKIKSTILALAAVLFIFVSCKNEGSSDMADNSDYKNKSYFTMENGELIRPTGYRSWVYVGTPVTPNDMNNGKAAFPEMHNVYIDPASYDHYKNTGKFREGTILMKELVSVGSKAAVEILKQIKGKTKYLITPGMVELGEQEYQLNYEFGIHASKNADYIILVGKKQTEPIQKALKDAKFPTDKIFVAKDFFEGNMHFQTIAKSGDVVLYENDLPDTYNE